MQKILTHYKKIIFLFFLGLSSCSNNTTSSNLQLPSWVDSKMKKWIAQHGTGEWKGWSKVKWSQNLLASVGSIQDKNTNTLGKAQAEKLNTFFKNTSFQGLSKEVGAYYNSGILVHGWDGYDAPDNLITPNNDYLASTYLRTDVSRDIKHAIWNHSFQNYSLGEPSAGVIYKNLSELENNYMVNCSYPSDAASDGRFLGCNTHKIDIQSGAVKDYKKEVQALWDAKKSINACQFDNIYTVEEYLSQSKRFGICSLSGSQNNFNLMIKLHREISVPADISFFMWNEIVLRILGDRIPSYRKSIAAFFYLSSSADDYYAVPTGELKKYNIHLGHAQKQQKMAKDTGLFIPIIEINMDSVKNGGSPFYFHLEDQIVKA